MVYRRRHRLGRRREFAALRDHGRRIDTGPFVTWWRRRGEDEEVPWMGGQSEPDLRRFAVTASRRIGPAVVRNRLKRVFRALFQGAYTELPAGVDLWIQLKGDCRAVAPTELRRRLLVAADRYLRGRERGSGDRPIAAAEPGP